MDLLLATLALIWFLNGDKKLSEKAKTNIEDLNNTKLISIVSIWEIAIKISLEKLRFSKRFNHLLELIEENGFEILPISPEHAIIVSTLEFIHRDPFDRLLVAQSKNNSLTIITKDDNIKKCKVPTIW